MQHQRSEEATRGGREAPPLGQYHDVGGRRLLLHRSGSGGPGVVFLPGSGMVGLDYLNVHERAAEFTTSVVYDRGGTGWSDRVDLPRTLAEVVDELRELLRVADVPAPYLLVGHSLGGNYARNYAQRFPEEVAGLLLVEPDHEDYDAYMPQELNEMRSAWDPDESVPDDAVRFYRGLFAKEMADWPEQIREALIDFHVSPEGLAEGAQQTKNRDQLHEGLRCAGPLPDVPLIVLTAMGIDAFKEAVLIGETEAQLRAEIEGKRRLYTALAESVPRGENRLVDGAGHVTVFWRRPDAVAQAIGDLVDAFTGSRSTS